MMKHLSPIILIRLNMAAIFGPFASFFKLKYWWIASDSAVCVLLFQEVPFPVVWAQPQQQQEEQQGGVVSLRTSWQGGIVMLR